MHLLIFERTQTEARKRERRQYEAYQYTHTVDNAVLVNVVNMKTEGGGTSPIPSICRLESKFE